MKLQFESPCGSCDDTAANRLQIKCRNLFRTVLTPRMIVGSTNWGSYRSIQWDDNRSNEWLCGTKARIENRCGGGDDTALNGIRVGLCKIPSTLNMKIVPQGDVTCSRAG